MLTICETDLHRYEWPELVVELTDFSIKSGDVSAQVRWLKPREDRHGQWETFDHGKLNLTADRTRDMKVKKFTSSKRAPALTFDIWEERLLYVTDTSQRRWKTRGEPEQDISKVTVDRTRPSMLLPPFVASDDISMLFAAPAAGKSMMSAAMALSMASNLDILDIQPTEQVNTLYLDWEDSSTTFRMRCESLLSGYNSRHMEDNAMPENRLWYRRMDTSLALAKNEIRKVIRRRDIGCIFVDSLSLAGGDPNDANNALEVATAVRSLNRPTVIIHHMSKAASRATQRDERDPYGSMFNSAAPRLAWSMDKHQEDGETQSLIQLSNYKSNRYQKFPAEAYEIQYTNDELGNLSGVYYKKASVLEFVEAKNMTEDMTAQEAVFIAIRDSENYPSAEALVTPVSNLMGRRPDDEISEEQIRVYLKRLKDRGRIKVHTTGEKNRKYWAVTEGEGSA